MQGYTNASILAAVVAEWCRPAVGQIASSQVTRFVPGLLDVQQQIVNTGIVGGNYKITDELSPFVASAVDIMLQPTLEQFFARVPDEQLPQLAHAFVGKAMEQPTFSVLDGLVTFDQTDMQELKRLLELNLPLESKKSYKVKK